MYFRIKTDLKLKYLQTLKSKEFLFPLTIVIVSLASWFQSLFIPFLNDDYQIIGWHNPSNFWEIFKPFWTADVSVYYWRPLVFSIHSLTVWLFGFYSFPIHLVGLLIYLTLCLVFFSILKNIGISPINSMLTTLLFSLTPSHEMVLGWIGGRADLTASLFVLLSFNFFHSFVENRKNSSIFLYFLFLFLGVLSKEFAIVAILIPFFPIFKQKCDKRFRIFIYGFFIASISFSLRFLFINVNPATSPNFSNFNILRIFRNLFFYLYASFFSVEQFQNLNFINFVLIFLIILAVSIFIQGLVKNYFKKDNHKSLIIQTGLLWYLIFCIPFLMFFMRWYIFAASIGLFISFGASIDLEQNNSLKKLSLIITSLIIILCVFINQNRMNGWIETGKKANDYLSSIKLTNLKNVKRIILWGTPSKISGINCTKVGIQQAVHYSGVSLSIDIFSPLQLEIFGQTKVQINKKAVNEYELVANSARFLPIFSNPPILSKSEQYYLKNNEYELKISTFLRNDSLISISKIKIFNPSATIKNMFFDGNRFIAD